MRTLEQLDFDNSYARLGEPYGYRVRPTPAPEPRLVAFNPDAAALIDLDPAEAEKPAFAECFSGGRPLPGAEPVAMAYSGHQFGVRVPQLGDGRAILLGEAKGADGARWDLHLKGSGRTPFSRHGDGYAVLRSSIREYLCGEAMHHLGVPTTRTLCVVGSPAPVYRETVETRALIVRMAPSHVRFGSFELFFFRHLPEPGVQRARLARLADYTIEEHFPEIAAAHPGGPARYGAWAREVSLRTARLMARWQAVGFAHGVMNTDNMSILGLTLDYGPFGFLDRFDPYFIPNHSDHAGRYSFANQPSVGLWNVDVLIRALGPLLDEAGAEAAAQAFEPEFYRYFDELMRAKLGLRTEQPEDGDLQAGLFQALYQGKADYTRAFRAIGAIRLEACADPAADHAFAAELREPAAHEAIRAWLARYRARLRREGATPDQDAARREAMDAVNPRFILRNHLAQEAIEAAEGGDFAPVDRLLDVLRRPFDDQPGRERYAEPPAPGSAPCVISCSS